MEQLVITGSGWSDQRSEIPQGTGSSRTRKKIHIRGKDEVGFEVRATIIAEAAGEIGIAHFPFSSFSHRETLRVSLSRKHRIEIEDEPLRRFLSAECGESRRKGHERHLHRHRH